MEGVAGGVEEVLGVGDGARVWKDVLADWMKCWGSGGGARRNGGGTGGGVRCWQS